MQVHLGTFQLLKRRNRDIQVIQTIVGGVGNLLKVDDHVCFIAYFVLSLHFT